MVAGWLAEAPDGSSPAWVEADDSLDWAGSFPADGFALLAALADFPADWLQAAPDDLAATTVDDSQEPGD